MSDPHRSPSGTLYVIATPIGNLGDITLRALEILRHVDLIAAEDTRHTQRLLKSHGIVGRLRSYHEHNESQRTPELVERLRAGENIALVSDAGTPMISDPGYRLVREAIAQSIPVVPIPGAAAAIAALCVSGFATDAFTFLGFPPRRKEKRLRLIESAAKLTHTLIFYQSPLRIEEFVGELLAGLGDRRAMLAREMTKSYEEFMHGRLSEILARCAARETVKGECTLLVEGAEADDHADEMEAQVPLEQALAAALADRRKPLGEIAKTLSRQYGRSRKEVYDLALTLRDRTDD
jgi:16S rRNA (cytidine1402-2'-O)-methyltransferase